MTDLDYFLQENSLASTSVFLGAGAAVPVGGPTAASLVGLLGTKFGFEVVGLTLQAAARFVELRYGREALVGYLRDYLHNLQPSGGLKGLCSLPLVSVFTTNYDTLVERAASSVQKSLRIVRSNHDFRSLSSACDMTLFKIHGCITSNETNGSSSRIIITSDDYRDATSFRSAIYRDLSDCVQHGSLVIIGYSLSDPEIEETIREATQSRRQSGRAKSVLVYSYTRNEALAEVYRADGLLVEFGGLDDFVDKCLIHVSKTGPSTSLTGSDEDITLDPLLQVRTVEVKSDRSPIQSIANLVSGRSPNYADIAAGHTFERDQEAILIDRLISRSSIGVAVLGGAGIGKTTLVRRAGVELTKRGWHVWEHRNVFDLDFERWLQVEARLRKLNCRGLLHRS